MYNKRVQYAIGNFIMEQYFLPENDSYCLREEKDSGKSSLNVSIKKNNLCVYDFDNKKKCSFLKPDRVFGMQKSVDHVLFEEYETDCWRLHLIEMKSGVGYSTWLESIKPKMRASYLTSLAVADFLGIQISDVITYTTYEEEKFTSSNNGTNPRSKIPLLGMVARNPFADEWNAGKIYLNVGNEIVFKHRKIQMIKNPLTGVLEGSLVIE